MKVTVAPFETSAWCVRIVTVSGPTIRLTTYPHDMTMSNATVYLTDSGYEQTAYSATTNFSPSAIDLTGIAGIAGITRDQIASGVFDNARVYVFKCNFLTPVEDYEPIASGFFGKTTLEDEKYTIQGMSLIDALNQSVGKTYTAACSRTFGDIGCTKSLAALDVTGTLTSVASSMVFRDSARSEAADYFGAGTIQFTTGNNAGLKPMEVKAYALDGTVTLFEPTYYAPTIGDAYVLIPGCRKRLEDCRDKWNNVINFFGFSNVPTSSTYQQVAGNR